MLLKGLCSIITILAFMAASLLPAPTPHLCRNESPAFNSFKVTHSGVPSVTLWEIKPSIPKIFYRLLSVQVFVRPIHRIFVAIFVDVLTPAVVYLMTIQAARGPPALA